MTGFFQETIKRTNIARRDGDLPFYFEKLIRSAFFDHRQDRRRLTHTPAERPCLLYYVPSPSKYCYCVDSPRETGHRSSSARAC